MKKRNVVMLASSILLGSFLVIPSLTSCNRNVDTTSYSITVEGEHVRLGGLPDSSRSGRQISFMTMIDNGYQIGSDGININTTNGEMVILINNNDGTYSFTMPSSDIVISVDIVEVTTPYDVMQNLTDDERYQVVVTGTKKGFLDQNTMNVSRIIDVSSNAFVLNDYNYGIATGYINLSGGAGRFVYGTSTETGEQEYGQTYYLEAGNGETYQKYQDGPIYVLKDLSNSGLTPIQTNPTYDFVLTNQNYADDFNDSLVWGYYAGLTGTAYNYLTSARYTAIDEGTLRVDLKYNYTDSSGNTIACDFTLTVYDDPQDFEDYDVITTSQVEEDLSSDDFTHKTQDEKTSATYKHDVLDAISSPYSILDTSIGFYVDQSQTQVEQIDGRLYFNPTPGEEYIVFDAGEDNPQEGVLPTMYGFFMKDGALCMVDQNLQTLEFGYNVAMPKESMDLVKEITGRTTDFGAMSYVVSSVAQFAISLDEFGLVEFQDYYELMNDSLTSVAANTNYYWVTDLYNNNTYTQQYDMTQIAPFFMVDRTYCGTGISVKLSEETNEVESIGYTPLLLGNDGNSIYSFEDFYTYSGFGETSARFDAIKDTLEEFPSA